MCKVTNSTDSRWRCTSFDKIGPINPNDTLLDEWDMCNISNNYKDRDHAMQCNCVLLQMEIFIFWYLSTSGWMQKISGEGKQM